MAGASDRRFTTGLSGRRLSNWAPLWSKSSRKGAEKRKVRPEGRRCDQPCAQWAVLSVPWVAAGARQAAIGLIEDEPGLAIDELAHRVEVAGMGGRLGNDMQNGFAQVGVAPVGPTFGPVNGRAFEWSRDNYGVR